MKELKDQQVRSTSSNKVHNKTVYEVEPSQDVLTPSLEHGKVKYGKHEVRVYRDTRLFEEWCNY